MDIMIYQISGTELVETAKCSKIFFLLIFPRQTKSSARANEVLFPLQSVPFRIPYILTIYIVITFSKETEMGYPGSSYIVHFTLYTQLIQRHIQNVFETKRNLFSIQDVLLHKIFNSFCDKFSGRKFDVL